MHISIRRDWLAVGLWAQVVGGLVPSRAKRFFPPGILQLDPASKCRTLTHSFLHFGAFCQYVPILSLEGSDSWPCQSSVGKVTVLMAEGTVDEAYYCRRKEQKMHHHRSLTMSLGSLMQAHSNVCQLQQCAKCYGLAQTAFDGKSLKWAPAESPFHDQTRSI